MMFDSSVTDHVCAPVYGIRIVVWGWDDDDLHYNACFLEFVMHYVVCALSMGLNEDEISDDLFGLFNPLITDANVEIGEDNEIEVVLVPVGA